MDIALRDAQYKPLEAVYLDSKNLHINVISKDIILNQTLGVRIKERQKQEVSTILEDEN